MGDFYENYGKDENGNEKLTQNQKKEIALGVINGIVNIHSRGYIHRDIKLENVFLNKVNVNGQEKLEVAVGDFGITCKIHNDQKAIDDVMCHNLYINSQKYYGANMKCHVIKR